MKETDLKGSMLLQKNHPRCGGAKGIIFLELHILKCFPTTAFKHFVEDISRFTSPWMFFHAFLFTVWFSEISWWLIFDYAECPMFHIHTHFPSSRLPRNRDDEVIRTHDHDLADPRALLQSVTGRVVARRGGVRVVDHLTELSSLTFTGTHKHTGV